ncbi:MAG: RNA polymerase sigma-70 factor, ECF subfamily [Bacteroidetes bacterium]|nr:MAG: RNA polymerase sigma-70 factor, ECF subfamily [Bacteroidota bacterium]
MNIVIEDQLLRDCSRGDSKAQYKLYRACYSFLMGICIRYAPSREDAEELLNSGFLKVLNQIDKRRPEVPFVLWIRRIMINTIIDEFRKKKLERETIEYVDFGESPDEYDAVSVNEFIARMDVEQLQVLIDRLPQMSRKVFNLFVVDGYGHKEIAEMLGMSEGTSKWHVNFSRNKLKEWLAASIPNLQHAAS